MALSSLQNPYDHLDKPALIALVMKRDIIIQEQQQDLLNAAEQIEKISRLLKLRTKKIFGSSSEKSSHNNAPEDIEFEELKDKDTDTDKDKDVQEDKAMQPVQENPSSVTVPKKKRIYKNGHPGRSPLPDHLRRVVEHFYPEGYQPDWNRELPPEITERLVFKLDVFVKADIYHKYARNGNFAMAPRPLDDPFYKYKATTDLVCLMMHLRFGLHLPYYRFLQLLPGCGLSYNTLIGWSARGFEILMPLKAILAEEILKDAKLVCMDETPFKLLDTPAKVMEFRTELKAQETVLKELTAKEEAEGGNKKQNKTVPSLETNDEEDGNADLEAELAAGVVKGKVVLRGQMWTLLNPILRLVSYEFSSSRSTINVIRMLKGYKGALMADAYTAYRRLARLYPEAIILLACWAHARRKIFESQDPKFHDKVVKEIMRRIGALYEIERKIKGRSPKTKKKLRKQSTKILRSLKKYMESKQEEYVPKEPVYIAIQYCLNHWDALSAYPRQKFSIIDNNPAERAIKPLTIARKNILFLGSVKHSEGAALLYSLMECCKLQKINPQAWLLDVMKRIECHPKNQLADLLPHRWKPLMDKPPS
jgi:hypothetical protein